MRIFVKTVTLLLAFLMLMTSFVACGGAEESETVGSESETQGAVSTETEDPRLAVKDDIPADLSFANAADATLTFFVRDDSDLWKYEMDVNEITNDTLYDAIYERNRKVEKRLGVEITTIGQPGNWSNRNSWNETLRNAVNTKTGDYDAAAIYLSTGSALAVEGMYYNLLDFPNLSLEKPWWNRNIQEETTLFDNLFYLAGDMAITETAGGYAIFYNKELYDRLYTTRNLDLYQTVHDGKWTIDLMYELVEGAWADDNASGFIDDGDTIGFSCGDLNSNGDGGMDAWVPAMGLRLTTMNDGIPELSFYNERSVAAFEKLQKLHADNPGTLAGGTKVDSTFSNGKQLFNRGTLNMGASLRDMEQAYGVLPLPKFDEDQASYQTSPANTASLVVVLSSCPVDKTEMVGATLELMAAESYRQVTPKYYETVLKSKYSNDPRDAEMYDLILDTFVFTFGFIYSTQSIGGIGSIFRVMASDFAQTYEANETKYQTALETLIDKLDELSFNMG